MTTTPTVREIREQIRADIREGRRSVRLPETLPPFAVRLDTPHVPTVVDARDVAEVQQVAVNALGLRGLVVLRDGTRHFVPDARPVADALRATLAQRRRRAC